MKGVGLTQRAMIFNHYLQSRQHLVTCCLFYLLIKVRHLHFDVQGWPAAELLHGVAHSMRKCIIQSYSVFINRTKENTPMSHFFMYLKHCYGMLTYKLAFK